MALIIRAPRRKTDAPEGTWHAVCTEVCDLGLQINQFDKKKEEKVHKVEICWELSETNPESNVPYFVAKEYTFAFGERAALRRDVEFWLARKLQPGEGFDLESLVGKNCRLVIEERTTQWNNTYKNLVAVAPVTSDADILQIRSDYVKQPQPQPETAVEITDDDIPF